MMTLVLLEIRSFPFQKSARKCTSARESNIVRKQNKPKSEGVTLSQTEEEEQGWACGWLFHAAGCCGPGLGVLEAQ